MNIDLSLIGIDALILVLTAIAFFALYKLSKTKKLSFPILLLVSLVMAVAFGGISVFAVSVVEGQSMFGSDFLNSLPTLMKQSNIVPLLSFISSVFTSLMQVLVVPLVFLAILNVIINQKQQTSNKVILRAIIGFVIMVAVSALVAIGFTMILQVGKGVNLDGLEATGALADRIVNAADKAQSYNFFSLLSSFLPKNIIADMASGSMIAVIIFAFLTGISMNKVRKNHEEGFHSFASIVSFLFETFTNLIKSVITILPYSIFAMIFKTVLASNFSSITALLNYVVAILLAMAIVFVLQLVVLMINGVNPIQYLKNVGQAIIIAFSTASSNATLPVAINSLENNQKIDEKVANIVPTLGTTMGMAGCGAVFPAILVIMTYQALGMPIDIFMIIQLVVVIALASFGMQGVPGTALYAATLALTTLNLPLAIIVLVTPIDFFVDMFRTALNVNGSLTLATVIDKRMKK